MRTVRINKGDLVNALTANRKQHKEDFTKASEAYRVDMLAFLATMSVRIEAGENVNVVHAIKDYPPEDHTGEYDVALRMLEMSADSVIELTDAEFRNMVLDDWAWKERWSAMNSKYLGK